jgi:hypothetical protein
MARRTFVVKLQLQLYVMAAEIRKQMVDFLQSSVESNQKQNAQVVPQVPLPLQKHAVSVLPSETPENDNDNWSDVVSENETDLPPSNEQFSVNVGDFKLTLFRDRFIPLKNVDVDVSRL